MARHGQEATVSRLSERAEAIAAQVMLLEESMKQEPDDTFVPVCEVVMLIAAARADLESALLDEEIYSERTKGGFPNEPGRVRVNEKATSIEWHGTRAHYYRFSYPGIPEREL